MCPAVLRLGLQVERRRLRDSDLLHLRVRHRNLDQTARGPGVREPGFEEGRVDLRAAETGDILVTDKHQANCTSRPPL